MPKFCQPNNHIKLLSTIICLLILSSGYTLLAAPRYWVAGTASNWNNTSNWSATSGGAGGVSVPGVADAVNFDNGGLGNCSIDATVSIASISVASGYTGVIAQGANVISISGAANFSAGTFTGGTANITVSGVFTLSGAAFTSTAAVLEFKDNTAFTSGTFSANTGTVRYNISGAHTIAGTSPSFYNLILTSNSVGLSTLDILSAGIIVVSNTLSSSGVNPLFINTGSIDALGDITIGNTSPSCGGTGLITINGAGVQNVNGAPGSDQGKLPRVTINKSSGTLNLFNVVSIGNDFTYTAGSINAGTSTVAFGTGVSTITGTASLNNISFVPNSTGLTVSILSTIVANGNLTMEGTGSINLNTGVVEVKGNVILTNTRTGAGGGSASITLTGTSSQSLDGSAILIDQCRLPIITINKPSGTLSLLGNITLTSDFTNTAGSINAGTSLLYVTNNSAFTGNFSLYNLTINATVTIAFTVALGNTITVLNDFTISGTSPVNINTGTVAAKGNTIYSNTSTSGGGSGTILLNGTGAQSVTSSGVKNQGRFPNVAINKASGTLTFPAIISIAGNWTYTAGTLDVTTNNSTVAFTGTLTITGSHTLQNIDFYGAASYIFTISPGTVITVNGMMSISGTFSVNINTGNISLNGDLNLTNTATGGGGSTLISIVGTIDQNIISGLIINQCRLPSITINKSSGTLIFPALITVAGNWTYTMGTLDVTSNNSTVVFAATLTITGSHSLTNIHFYGAANYTITITPGTVLTVNGSMSISGTGNVTLTSGNINLYGDLSLTNTATSGGGTTIISFLASVDQSIISSLVVYQSKLPAITINKPSGTLVFPSLITVRSNWVYTAGTLDVSTNSSTVVFNSTLAIQGVAHQLNNVTFDPATTSSTFTINTDILTVGGVLTLAGTSGCTINASTAATNAVIAKGNITVTNNTNNGGGNGIILINGTANQNLTGSGTIGSGRLPYITINKASGTLFLLSIISAVGGWTHTAGIVDAGLSTVGLGVNALSVDAQGMNFYNFNVFTSGTRTLLSNLNVDGNLTITAGTLAGSTKTINLKGNWTNIATANFTEGTSTVNLIGNALQTITCPAGENFYSLAANNSSTGIKLINNATVANTLTMTSGNIDLNTNALTLGVSVASNGTLSRTFGTIINTGSFVRWFKAISVPSGSINGLFPVGTASDYRPFYVSAPTTAPTTGGTISTSYVDAAFNSNVTITDGASTIFIIKNLKWTLLAANGLAGGTYDIQIQGTNYGSIGAPADLRLSLVSSVVGTAGTNAGPTSNPQVNRRGLSLANLSNTFYLGSVDAFNSPLPIKLISFTAIVVNQWVNIKWETATENQNDFFTLLRSKDGVSWEALRYAKGKGNSQTTQLYNETDSVPYNGLSYYRLIDTDFDGQENFSTIRAVHFKSETTNVSIYPNPASSIINVSGYKKFKLRVFNNYGEEISTPPPSEISSTYVLNISELPAGIYMIELTHENFIEIKRVIITR